MRTPILYTRDLTVGYNKKAVIKDIAFGVHPGEILTLIGPNGAGKSTILKSIVRQLEIVSGTVFIGGRDASEYSGIELAKKLSVLLTGRLDTELMTCRDVVSAGRYPYTGRLGILSAHDREVVERSMELVHVTELADRDFTRISDGQRQRVLLAKAICQEPEILIMDEPTSYLDIRHKLELIALLKELVRKQNLAVIVSLHELDLAQRCSDRILCAANGVISAYGTPEEIFTGNYIEDLYGIRIDHPGSFNNTFGVVELKKTEAAACKAKVFVIGGAGYGIPVYRRLQREGTPFYAGILFENDIDCPVADALAECVLKAPAFGTISEEVLLEACRLIETCDTVICALPEEMMRGSAAPLCNLLRK